MASALTNPSPTLEDVAITVPLEEAPSGCSPSEEFFVVNNRSLLALAVLSIGLLDADGKMLFDPKEIPWKSMKKKMVNPAVPDMKDEVKRRWDTFVTSSLSADEIAKGPPATKYWDKKQLNKWLCDHLIAAEEDVSFLRKVIAERIGNAEQAKKDGEWESDQLNAGKKEAKYKKWSGKYPYLRLIHALIDDPAIKRAYIHRDQLPAGRMQVENRKTAEARAAYVWQMVSDKYNDPAFAPGTAALGDIHPDFALSETILYELVCAFLPLTPESAKDRFESMLTLI